MPESDRCEHADVVPYIPVTSKIELPVEANTLGTAALTMGADNILILGFPKLEPVMQISQTDTIKDELPIPLGRRRKTAESDAQPVEGDADLRMRTRTLKLPAFPKLVPKIDTTVRPEDAAQPEEREEMLVFCWNARVNEAIAL